MNDLDATQIRDYVRERYGAIAEQDEASVPLPRFCARASADTQATPGSKDQPDVDG
jgi:predicted pyridoxine 5'-phosphate oxidase superfamily flavin-nucleotide-binding protein